MTLISWENIWKLLAFLLLFSISSLLSSPSLCSKNILGSLYFLAILFCCSPCKRKKKEKKRKAMCPRLAGENQCSYQCLISGTFIKWRLPVMYRPPFSSWYLIKKKDHVYNEVSLQKPKGWFNTFDFLRKYLKHRDIHSLGLLKWMCYIKMIT